MKPIFKILAAFFVIFSTIALADIIFGKIADNITQTKGMTKQHYIMSGSDYYDILFVGSSRAHRHYDTPYITDSLGFKTFNAGEDGRGLTYQYPLLKSYLQHNNPKIVVLEISPAIDGKWNERISMLYPLVKKYDEVISVAEMIDDANKYYLQSNLYRYNSNLISEMRGLRHPFTNNTLGFDPVLVSKAPAGTFDDNNIRSYLTPVDSVEYQVLSDMIRMCKSKDVDLVGVISPIYGKIDRRHDIDSIFRAYNVHFIDNTSFRLPLEPNNYFKDATHLNILGAREYTKYIMHQLTDSLQVIN